MIVFVAVSAPELEMDHDGVFDDDPSEETERVCDGVLVGGGVRVVETVVSAVDEWDGMERETVRVIRLVSVLVRLRVRVRVAVASEVDVKESDAENETDVSAEGLLEPDVDGVTSPESERVAVRSAVTVRLRGRVIDIVSDTVIDRDAVAS